MAAPPPAMDPTMPPGMDPMADPLAGDPLGGKDPMAAGSLDANPLGAPAMPGDPNMPGDPSLGDPGMGADPGFGADPGMGSMNNSMGAPPGAGSMEAGLPPMPGQSQGPSPGGRDLEANGQGEEQNGPRRCFGGSNGKMHSHSAYGGFILTAIAVFLLTLASLGTPFINGVQFIKATRPDAPQTYKVGLFGDCIIDHNLNLHQCSQPGFGFALQGYGLPDSEAIQGALGKSSTFWFIIPPTTAVLGMIAICSDNTRLALFYFLLITTALSALGSVIMVMVFSPAVKKLNADTNLEASVSIGLYMTIIASILLLVATFLSWESSAFQSCRPSKNKLGADDGRNEKRQWDDSFEKSRSKYQYDRDAKPPESGDPFHGAEGPPAYDAGMNGPPIGESTPLLGAEGVPEDGGMGMGMDGPPGDMGAPPGELGGLEGADMAGDAQPPMDGGAGLDPAGGAEPAGDPAAAAGASAPERQDSESQHNEEMRRQKELLESMRNAPKEKKEKKGKSSKKKKADDPLTYMLAWKAREDDYDAP